MYKHTDYTKTYGRIMQFNKNKQEPIHRWYPFVEGYSKDFIQSIIEEVNKPELVCLEPFAGSGTTSLEMQAQNYKCYSFEVNPLMHLISKVKLENKYDLNRIDYWHNFIKENRSRITVILPDTFHTLYGDEVGKRFNYSKETGVAINKIIKAIENVSEMKYQELFKVALASILLDSSNMYRNGKCLSYKKNWESRVIEEKTVFEKFDEKIEKEIKADIQKSSKYAVVCNKELLFNEDCRTGIDRNVADNTIDLVITSPPYLNSRDYTDTYMLELKTLGFTKSFEEIRELRNRTIRSHVQIKWKDDSAIENKLVTETLRELGKAALLSGSWNNAIVDMVRLYFVDMKALFNTIYKKMKYGGRVYFNVSNSAYYNVLINTLEICASIAQEEGFRIIEIRDARWLKTSPQQQKKIGKLLEGVIVMEKDGKQSA